MSDHNAGVETLWAAYEYWSAGLGGSRRSDFDQLIAAHDAEVAANALEQAAIVLGERRRVWAGEGKTEVLVDERTMEMIPLTSWIRQRAAEIRGG